MLYFVQPRTYLLNVYYMLHLCCVGVSIEKAKIYYIQSLPCGGYELMEAPKPSEKIMQNRISQDVRYRP